MGMFVYVAGELPLAQAAFRERSLSQSASVEGGIGGYSSTGIDCHHGAAWLCARYATTLASNSWLKMRCCTPDMI